MSMILNLSSLYTNKLFNNDFYLILLKYFHAFIRSEIFIKNFIISIKMKQRSFTSANREINNNIFINWLPPTNAINKLANKQIAIFIFLVSRLCKTIQNIYISHYFIHVFWSKLAMNNPRFQLFQCSPQILSKLYNIFICVPLCYYPVLYIGICIQFLLWKSDLQSRQM